MVDLNMVAEDTQSENAAFPIVGALDARDYRMADYSYEVIMDRIKEFEEGLDSDQETGVMLASFGRSVTMSVTDIGYSNPSTLVFYGYVNAKPATLIQHVSQLNFLLIAVPKADPEKPPRRIGFARPAEDRVAQSQSQYK